VAYEAIWLNVAGLERARSFATASSSAHVQRGRHRYLHAKNTNRSVDERIDELPGWAERYQDLGMDWLDVGSDGGLRLQLRGRRRAAARRPRAGEGGGEGQGLRLAPRRHRSRDTMGWANPLQMKRLVGTVRARWPQTPVKLHLHDTRALAIANVVAALEMGIDYFDSAVAGMGGCPFAAHKGAAGNITTEDLVFLCQEMGIDTGIDLDAMIEAGQLAERVVGHPLPGKLKSGGNLDKYRTRARAN
jgi:hydroxymethylglutaryl-CoA lyase